MNEKEKQACVMAHISVQTGLNYARVWDPENTSIGRRDEQPGQRCKEVAS